MKKLFIISSILFLIIGCDEKPEDTSLNERGIRFNSFNGNGYMKLYTSSRKISKVGIFKDYNLIDGLSYKYDEDDTLIRIELYQKGEIKRNNISLDSVAFYTSSINDSSNTENIITCGTPFFNDIDNYKDLIVGKWEVVKSSKTPFKHPSTCYNLWEGSTFEFFENSKIIVLDDSSKDTCNNPKYQQYYIKGKTIFIPEGDVKFKYQILSLDEDSLKFINGRKTIVSLKRIN